MNISSIVCFGTSPIEVFSALPFLKRITVGMLTMPNSLESSSSLSTFTLPTFILPSFSSAISARVGASILHGPHQSAQKSTRTGTTEFKTSDSKLAFVTVTSIINLVKVSFSAIKIIKKKKEGKIKIINFRAHLPHAADRAFQGAAVCALQCYASPSAPFQSLARSYVRAGFGWGAYTRGKYEIKTDTGIISYDFSEGGWYCAIIDVIFRYTEGEYRKMLNTFLSGEKLTVRRDDKVTEFNTAGFSEILKKWGITAEELDYAIANEEF